MNALHYTLIRNDLKTARILLEHGADPNELPEQEEDAVTPMHLAAGQGLDATRLLLQFNGDPNVRSTDFSTPLHIAATWGDLAVVKLLIQNGGDPQLLDEDGCRPVDVARTSGHPECVDFLQQMTSLLHPQPESPSPSYSCHSLSNRDDTPSTRDTLTSHPDQNSMAPSCSLHHPTASPHSPVCAQAQHSWKVTPERILLQKFIAARSPVSPGGDAGSLERCHASSHCHVSPQTPHHDFSLRSASPCGSVGAGIDILENHLRSHACCAHGENLHPGSPLCLSGYRHGGCGSNPAIPMVFPPGSEVLFRDRHSTTKQASAGYGHRQQDVSSMEKKQLSYCRSCNSDRNSCLVHNDQNTPQSSTQSGRCCVDDNVSSRRSTAKKKGQLDRPETVAQKSKGNLAVAEERSVKRSPCRNTMESSSKETQTSFLEPRAPGRDEETLQGGDPVYYSKYFPPLTPKSCRHSNAALSPRGFLEANFSSEDVGDSTLSESCACDGHIGHAERVPEVVYGSRDGLWHVEESIPSESYSAMCENNKNEPGFHKPQPSNNFSPSSDESGDETHMHVTSRPLQDKDLKNRSNRILHKESESVGTVYQRYKLAMDTRDHHHADSAVSCKPSSRRGNRRSSMYTSSLNQQIEQRLMARESVCLNVTSPDHPCLESKMPNVFPVELVHGAEGSKLGHQGKRSSVGSAVSDSSCDTFVTCGEEPEHQKMVVGAEVDTGRQTQGEGMQNPDSEVQDSSQDLSRSASTLAETVIEAGNITLRRESTARTKSFSHLPDTVMAACIKTAEESRRAMDVGQFVSGSRHSWHPPTLPIVDDSDLITSDESFLERGQHRSVRQHGLPGSTVGSLAASLENVSLHRTRSQHMVKSKSSVATLTNTDKWSRKNAWDRDVEDIGTTQNTGQDSNPSPQPSVHSSPDSQHRGLSPGTDSSSPESQRSSLGSIYSQGQVKEYLHTDHELGISFIERHVASECSGSARSSLDSQVSGLTVDSQHTQVYDWRQYSLQQQASLQTVTEEEEDQKEETTPVPESLQRLSNAEIRQSLVAMGDDPGPVVASTRQAYLVRLANAQKNPAMLAISTSKPGYSWELHKAMQGQLELDKVEDMEAKMVAPFQSTQSGRCWREGTAKSSFNYLLLDPRVSRNLPMRAKHMSKLEAFQTFIKAIFYVGKGKRARPYAHLYEALSLTHKPGKKASDKVQHILEIWRDGLGVVSLHCFQSVIPVEAYTREACMVDAIGLSHLTNQKRGDYYGPASTWSASCRRTLGVFLLQRALQIFLAEGERQICPPDLRAGP